MLIVDRKYCIFYVHVLETHVLLITDWQGRIFSEDSGGPLTRLRKPGIWRAVTLYWTGIRRLINVFTEARQRVRHSAHTFTLHFSKIFSNFIFPAMDRSPKMQYEISGSHSDTAEHSILGFHAVTTGKQWCSTGMHRTLRKICDCYRLVSIQSTQTV